MTTLSPKPEPKARLPELGTILAEKYRIDRVLGRGGMGIVYSAHHELLGKAVGIKLMLPEVAEIPEAVARFLNEARAASRIQSEHVARVMDVGRLADGLPYIVMEFLEGSDLDQLLTQGATFEIETAVDYILQALEAIAEAHAMGIVHRDLKPSNLFLARGEDGATRIKVLDFGISKATRRSADKADGEHITTTNAVLGSPSYMSPEQLRSSRTVDARSDVWALGVILYELLSGALPFNGEGVGALFASILEDQARPLQELRSQVPPGLEHVIHKCLRRKPEERWQSVTELARALEPFASRTGALSVERVARILPAPPSVLSVAPPPEPEPAASLHVAREVGPPRPPGGRTTASWHSDSGEINRPKRRGAWVWGAGALLLAATVSLAGIAVSRPAPSRPAPWVLVSPTPAAPADPAPASREPVVVDDSMLDAAPPPLPATLPAAPHSAPSAATSPRKPSPPRRNHPPNAIFDRH